MPINNLNKHWRGILDTLRDGVAVISREGKVVLVNQALCHMTGYQAHELINHPCTVFNCDACAQVRQGRGGHWCELFSRSQPEDRELSCRLIRKDGSYLPAMKRANLLFDDQGKVVGVVETVTDLSELDRRDRKIDELSHQLALDGAFMGLVGDSQGMKTVYQLIEKAAQGQAPVLITGESGTGKELVARAIHDLGQRREGPYVVFNCAALSESLFESELFGHVKGAFTGAHRHRVGRLESAHGGDFFMDEVGELSAACQVKLLRVLEEKHFERVGDQHPMYVDTRYIAATNRDLKAMLDQGLFRSDLYFRLNVIPIHLPPLRRRLEDIPILVEHFLTRLRQRTGKRISGVSRPVMEMFRAHPWPGNVRELRAALEYAFVVADQGQIQPSQLPPEFSRASRPKAQALKTDSLPREQAPSPAPLASPSLDLGRRDRHLREELIQALQATGGNQSQAAKLLGVSRATVWNRMHRLGVELRRQVRGRRD